MNILPFNGQIIETRSRRDPLRGAHDNKVNATQMCKAVGKDFDTWLSFDTTKAFIDQVIKMTGLSKNRLIERTDDGVVFVHKLISDRLAASLGVEFHAWYCVHRSRLFSEKSLVDLQDKAYWAEKNRAEATKLKGKTTENALYKEACDARKITKAALFDCDERTPAQHVKDKYLGWRYYALNNTNALNNTYEVRQLKKRTQELNALLRELKLRKPHE